MESEDFEIVLRHAISGNRNDVEKILEMYEPLIKGHSYIKGKLDEDLRQYILIHVFKNIKKFKI